VAKQKAPRPPRGLANPTELQPIQKKPEESMTGTEKPGDQLLQVIIETPRGSRNKYSFDEKQHIFLLKAALPAGMVFPYDFGFIPQTIGGDGDPLDVLVLMDEPCFPGCALLVRLIGVMESEQTEKGKTNRNDRLIAVADAAHIYSPFRHVDDLPEQTRTEISDFFSNYHKLQGRQSKTLAWKGPNKARKLIEQGMQPARKQPEQS
jgi:inorganic pyrophosphatase